MNFKHLLLPLAAGLACYAQTTTAQSTMTPKTSSSKSLHFIENKGQVTDQFHEVRTDIDFKLSGGNGLNIFFGKGKIHYQWSQRTPLEDENFNFQERGTAEAIEKLYSQPVEMYRLDVELLNANPYAQVITENQQPFFERYFLSWVNTNNSNEGVKANAYKKITYKDIYPNIDWVFYFNANGQLEHDFIVHPGGRVSDIRIKYSGTTNLQLNPDGSLTASSPMGTITENAPYSYTLNHSPSHYAHSTPAVTAASVAEALEALEASEAIEVVASKFHLNNNILSFEVADYSGTLVIDPIVEWGTYFGGSDDETSHALTTDKWGNIYMAGSTSSTGNIATVGAHQTTFAGGTNTYGADAFLSKWDKAGNLLWATYYGGDKVDVAKGIGCDTVGNVYMGGFTNSTAGISTTGSYQENKAGVIATRYDAFIVKLDTSGQRVWGTYFGGAQTEASTSMSLTTDQLGHVYITGNTQSADLPITSGCHQATNAGAQDAFIAQFDWNGDLNWSTYYGGAADEYPYALAADAAGSLYITGYTLSTTGIATPGSYQSVIGGGRDAFISKFDIDGQMLWGTYLGGNEIDEGRAISVLNGMVIVGGNSISTSGIATSNAHQVTFGGYGDGFLAKFDQNGQIGWATYYGGANSDAIQDVWISGSNEIYVSGNTQSADNITTPGSYKESFAGLMSALFLAKFNENGARQWGTYYGGKDINDFGFVIGDASKNIYLSGYTNSATDIATANGNSIALQGGYDAFLVRFNDCEAADLPSAITGPIEVCAHSKQVYSVSNDFSALNYEWLLPLGWTGSSDSNAIHLTIGDENGTIQVVAISACGGISDTQKLAITALPIPDPEIVNNNNILSTKQSYSTYQWNKNGLAIEDAIQATYLVEANGSYSVTVTNVEGCENTSDTTTITDIVGIQEAEDFTGLSLYPNPAKNEINIQSSTFMSVEMYSIEGKLIEGDIQITPGINRLNISHLPSGVYFLKFKNKKAQPIIKKFMIE